jgi:Tfp pilus assembly protein PilV
MKHCHSQQGSFIIEAIISLILFAVGLISLMSLSAQAINQVGQSKARNDASYLVGELLSEMWVSGTVNVTTWNTRLQTVLPEATGTVYFANCDCTATSGADLCSGAASGTAVAVGNSQAVTVCVNWTDRRDPATPRRYQASSMITRNSQ